MKFYQKDFGQGIFITGDLVKKIKSPFQKIAIFDSEFFGRVLAIDGNFQLSQKDEFIYHEPMAHIPFIFRNNIKNTLAIGAGDGCLVRELLKHKSLEGIVICDLDRAIVDLSAKYLTGINQDVLKNKKVRVNIGDGFEFLQKENERYDLIFMDITDPCSNTMDLFSEESFSMIKKSLVRKGLLVLYAGAPLLVPDFCRQVQNNLKKVFKFKQTYINYIPVFGTVVSFAVCSQTNIVHPVTKAIDKKLIAEKIKGLKYYSGRTHRAMFSIPPYLIPILD